MVLPGLSIDWNSSEPVYRQIAEGVREAARSGRLRHGHRLPPTRDLARQLEVNRNTVVAAYEMLASEGWIRSHTGKGTFLVSPAEGGGPPVEPASAGTTWFNAFSRAVAPSSTGALQSIYQMATDPEEGISFVGSYPADELIPTESFAKAVAKTLSEAGSRVLAYGASAGESGLRETIAASMQGSVETEDILITNGAQQALGLVFRTFVERGDAVVIEEPTYTGALGVLESLGARVVGVPLDDEGIRPDLLAIALERHRPRLLYVQPTFQNPTTRVMSAARRAEVLDLARRFRCTVVEDDWAGDLRLEGENLPTLHSMDGGRHVVYLSTFSKKLMPGLRVGWVAAPPPVLERLVALKRLEDCGTSPLIQASLDTFLRSGGLDEHLRRARPVYRERRDRMLAALERHLPAGARWIRPEGGLFVWVDLAPGIDGSDLFVAARQRGVAYSPGDLFRRDGKGTNSLRLTFAAVAPEVIDTGVAILGELIGERCSGNQDRGRQATVEARPIF